MSSDFRCTFSWRFRLARWSLSLYTERAFSTNEVSKLLFASNARSSSSTSQSFWFIFLSASVSVRTLWSATICASWTGNWRGQSPFARGRRFRRRQRPRSGCRGVLERIQQNPAEHLVEPDGEMIAAGLRTIHRIGLDIRMNARSIC